VNGDIDFETRKQYIVTVAATDNGAPRQTGYTNVTVNVINKNDPPNIDPQEITFGENLPVGSFADQLVVGTDPDSDDVMTFSIVSGDEIGLFSINNATGQLRNNIAGVMDFESTLNNKFTIRVMVNDRALAFATAEITVLVTDHNDPPALVPSARVLNVTENSPNGTVIGSICTPKSSGGGGASSLPVDGGPTTSNNNTSSGSNATTSGSNATTSGSNATTSGSAAASGSNSTTTNTTVPPVGWGPDGAPITADCDYSPLQAYDQVGWRCSLPLFDQRPEVRWLVMSSCV
jgi:hypothetical protein